MAKVSFAKVAAGAVLTGVIAFAGTPDGDTPLSTQRGDAAAAKEDIARLTEEGRALSREYNELKFLATSLAAAQQSLANRQDDVGAQVRELDKIHSQYQERLQARNTRASDFHNELLISRTLSEADARALYTGPYDGTYYTYYYTQTMAYRDECKSDTSCMEDMQKSEKARAMQSYAISHATGFGVYMGSMFGLSALAGWRRRRSDNRQQRQHASNIGAIKNMLTPKGRG